MTRRIKELQSLFILKVLSTLYECHSELRNDERKIWCFEHAQEIASDFVNKEGGFRDLPDEIYDKNEITKEELLNSRGSTQFTVNSFWRKAASCKSRFLDMCAAWHQFLNNHVVTTTNTSARSARGIVTDRLLSFESSLCHICPPKKDHPQGILMFKAYGPISRELFGLEPINLFPQKSDGRGVSVHSDIPPVAGTGAPATDCPLVCEDTDSSSGTENLQSPLEKSKKKRTLVAEKLSPRSEIYKIFINNYSRGEAFFEALEEFKMKESNIMLDRSFNIIDDEEARKRILEIREEYAIKRQRIDIMFPEKVVYDLPNDDPSSVSSPVQLSTNNKGSNYSDNGSDSDQST